MLGPDHLHVALSLNGLADLLHEAGSPAEATALHRQSLAILEQSLPEDSPQVARQRANLARNLYARDITAEARDLYRRALPVLMRRLGPMHDNIVEVAYNLGRCHAELGEFAAARRAFEQALHVASRSGKYSALDLAELEGRLAKIQLRQRRPNEALAHAERMLTLIRQAKGSPTDMAAANTLIAFALWDSGRDHPHAMDLAQQVRAVLLADRKSSRNPLAEIEEWISARAAASLSTAMR